MKDSTVELRSTSAHASFCVLTFSFSTQLILQKHAQLLYIQKPDYGQERHETALGKVLRCRAKGVLPTEVFSSRKTLWKVLKRSGLGTPRPVVPQDMQGDRSERHRHPVGIAHPRAPEAAVTHLLLPCPTSAPFRPVQMDQWASD